MNLTTTNVGLLQACGYLSIDRDNFSSEEILLASVRMARDNGIKPRALYNAVLESSKDLFLRKHWEKFYEDLVWNNTINLRII